MAGDPHVLRPDHLPTPFTAAEIREASVPGRTVRMLVVQGEAEPHVRVTRFVSGDAEGGEGESWTERPDGRRLTEPEGGRATWLELQEHASMPADATRIDEEIDRHPGRPVRLPALQARRSATRSTRSGSRRSAPGMPLRFEQRVGGELVFSSTAIEDRRPSSADGLALAGQRGWRKTASPIATRTATIAASAMTENRRVDVAPFAEAVPRPDDAAQDQKTEQIPGRLGIDEGVPRDDDEDAKRQHDRGQAIGGEVDARLPFVAR